MMDATSPLRDLLDFGAYSPCGPSGAGQVIAEIEGAANPGHTSSCGGMKRLWGWWSTL